MKKIAVLILSLLMIMFCLTGCNYSIFDVLRHFSDQTDDSQGCFYVKTPACIGDAGITTVISMEAEHDTYEGNGDITIPFTVGFGHLPGYDPTGGKDTGGFHATYSVYDGHEWNDSTEPVWQHIVEYTDSFYSEKYNSTEQKNSSMFIVIPVYGQFYPLYKETVYITFPADIQDGYVVINVEGAYPLSFEFRRVGNTLYLMEDNQ